MMRALQQLVEPLYRKLRLLVQRALVRLLTYDGTVRRVQLQPAGGSVLADIEHHEPYGFTSHPLDGAEAILVSLAGNRSHNLVLQIGDRRHRIVIAEGETALYTHLGDRVHIKNDRTIEVKAATKVVLDTPEVHCTQKLTVADTIEAVGAISTLATVSAVQGMSSQGVITAPDLQTDSGISAKNHTHNETGNVTQGPNL